METNIRLHHQSASFFFQAEAGIRDGRVTGVQTCALPISRREPACASTERRKDKLIKLLRSDLGGRLAFASCRAAADLVEFSFQLGQGLEQTLAVAQGRSEERRVGRAWK